MPIPCGSSVLHATPVVMSDATRGPIPASSHIRVGPSPRPDLCAGARRCRLSLALRRSFLPTRHADPTSRPDLPTRPPVPTRTTVLGRRETSRDAARDPRHPDPRIKSRRSRGHGLNSCPPQQLPYPLIPAACVGGNEWYLFSLRDLKYATGQRTNRATMSGYWKATGKDKPVTRKGLLVGMRKTLVFYQGRAPKGKKTKWVMHEFRMEGSDGAPKLPFKPDWALCRVFCNNRRISNMPSMEASHENSGSQSLSALMDNCITFGHTPFYSEGFEQVPCFSSLSPSYVSQCQDFVLTKCLAQTGGLPELNSGLNQLTGDRRDSRTVLNHLTKFEGDPKGKVVPQGGFEDYLTQSRLPSTWNP